MYIHTFILVYVIDDCMLWYCRNGNRIKTIQIKVYKDIYGTSKIYCEIVFGYKLINKIWIHKT